MGRKSKKRSGTKAELVLKESTFFVELMRLLACPSRCQPHPCLSQPFSHHGNKIIGTTHSHSKRAYKDLPPSRPTIAPRPILAIARQPLATSFEIALSDPLRRES
jgi:hypothetical protein